MTVEGTAPSWAAASSKVAAVAGGEQRRVQIALNLRDPRGAEALAKAVSAKGSAQHHKFLSAREFTERFAATSQTVERVSSWLRSQGLRVGDVSANRHFIDAAGTTAQLQAAFGVTLSRYRRTTSDGRTLTLTAPETPVSVPRGLHAAVQAVIGLDDSAKTVTTAQVTRRALGGTRATAVPAAPGEATSCARYWGESNNTAVPQKYPAGQQSNALCGYTAPQIRSLYSLTAANTGAGTTVAITGAYNAPTVVADTNRAAARFGGTALTAGQYTDVLPPSFDNQDKCGPESWAGEQALDVQSTHEIAPAAKLVYYGAKSCFDLYTALNKAVTDNKASIVSNSWLYPGETGVSQAERDQLGSIAINAVIQGQVLLFASGDSGDNSAVQTRAEPSFPASHPWVTAVGGTSVALDANNKVTFSTGWANSGNTQASGSWVPQQDKDGRFAGGAGGGVSTLYDAPDYQDGVVPTTVSHGKRAVPDIAALADSYTGIAIGQTTASGWVEYSSGGTSLAAPLLAGLVANAQQAQNIDRMGFLNGALYAQKTGIADVKPVKAGVWAPSMASFGYVTVPSGRGSYLLDFDSKPQSLKTTDGWDKLTGVGTPTAGFVTALGT